jgi:hypothetical protein
MKNRATAGRVDFRYQRVSFAILNVDDRDCRAFAGEEPRDGGADARGGPADPRRLIFQPLTHGDIFSFAR